MWNSEPDPTSQAPAAACLVSLGECAAAGKRGTLMTLTNTGLRDAAVVTQSDSCINLGASCTCRGGMDALGSPTVQPDPPRYPLLFSPDSRQLYIEHPTCSSGQSAGLSLCPRRRSRNFSRGHTQTGVTLPRPDNMPLTLPPQQHSVNHTTCISCCCLCFHWELLPPG